ncbi:hypothetical protein HOLleu_21391 [Holothuria leucospilota]|uniref:Uncharacterized protein n=1 Tax=Holothuria leucospilota TaxID=206669 RepID=A0A9Q1H6S1_HOLLE|nr:hypothetical protein HOLleu_21391 [Holothuria leucospilota]
MCSRARLLIAATEFSGSYASFELRVSQERRARAEHSPAVPCPVKDMLRYAGNVPVRNSRDFPISLADLQLTQQTYVAGGRAACQGRHVQPRETSHCSDGIFGQLRQFRAPREPGKTCESGAFAGCTVSC